MTGAGAPGAPGIIRCLQQDQRIRITVADADKNATGQYLNADFVVIPKAEDENFIPSLLNICRERQIQILMPLVTRELFPLAKHRDEFEKYGTRVLVSSHEAILLANDKSKCYQFLREKNISVPKFFVVKTIEQFQLVAKQLGWPENEFCFKPSVSNGSRGFRIVSNKVDGFDLLFNYKPNSTYIRYEDAVRILSSKTFPELLVSEYLPGEEYSVDCLAFHGEARLILPRLRKKMVNGISVQGEFVQDEFIIEHCRRILQALQLHGNIGIQVKRNAEGKALLLEINPRVQGTIVAGLGAGVNLPLLAVKQELNLPMATEELQVKWGTKFSRHWTEVFY